VAKPDEGGAIDLREVLGGCRSAQFQRESTAPSSAFGTFSPTEKRGGEGARYLAALKSSSSVSCLRKNFAAVAEY
jgi:hypothetical protein